MRHSRALLLCLVATISCGRTRPAPGPPPAPESAILDAAFSLPVPSGAILLSGVEFPEAGASFGGHFGGAGFDVRQFGYQMTDAVRAQWSLEARRRGERLLRAAGFRVHVIGPQTGGVSQLLGVQYGLSGRVAQLLVRSFGQGEPFRIEAQAAVEWELLDLGAGAEVIGRTMRHVARGTGSLDSLVGQAVDGSLAQLLADSAFRYALAQVRAEPDARTAARFRDTVSDDQTIDILIDDINPSHDSALIGRVAAGLVTLRSPAGLMGTAFLISRDGLALTSARLVRDRRLRARFPNGIERPVQVLRTHRGLDVALVQIACTVCTTVPWVSPEGAPVRTGIVTVGAAIDAGARLRVEYGRLGGRWGLAHGVTVELRAGAIGGEPIMNTATGQVFAMISSRGGRAVALMLYEVLEALRIRGPGMDAGER